MDRETQLWIWFLFGGHLGPQRAKTLLARWDDEGHTLAEVMSRLPQEAERLGLTSQEAQALHTRAAPPETPALRWNETLYPAGLRDLPLSRRPALLFYLGDVSLLSRPIIYLPAMTSADKAPMTNEQQAIIREIVSLLLGEQLLPATPRLSEQTGMMLKEMFDTEGELLLFSREGITTLTLTPTEKTFLGADGAGAIERLCILSPLPPDAEANPAWEPVLTQVELATAQRCIIPSLQTYQALQTIIKPSQWPPTLLIGDPPTDCKLPPQVQATPTPTDILPWLADALAPSDSTSPDHSASEAADAPLGADYAPEPPPSPEETLRILEKGGNIPEDLRDRLLGTAKE
jgi:hypothetical protein